MCKALCRLKIFSLSAQVVFLPHVHSFSLCGNTIAHWIYCCWWDWIMCITPWGRMPRSNPWGLILWDTEDSWYPARDRMGMGLEPPVGQHLRVHCVWSCWRYLVFPLALAAGRHSSPFLGLRFWAANLGRMDREGKKNVSCACPGLCAHLSAHSALECLEMVVRRLLKMLKMLC